MMQPTVMPAAENWLGEHLSRTFWLTLVGRVKPDYTPATGRVDAAGLDVLDPMMTKPATPGESPRPFQNSWFSAPPLPAFRTCAISSRSRSSS